MKSICLKCRKMFRDLDQRCCNSAVTAPLVDIRQTILSKHTVLNVPPGAHFDLRLPDGTLLNVEQTADDFSIVTGDGIVCYSRPTSELAKKTDGRDEERKVVSGQG